MSEFALSFLSGSQTANSSVFSGLPITQTTKVISHTYAANEQERNQRIQQLEQRVQLLEREKVELLEREENLKRTNEQIINAFDSCAPNVASLQVKPEELQILEDKHGREIKQLKKEKQDIQDYLSQENAKMLNRLSEKEADLFRFRTQSSDLLAQIAQKDYTIQENLKKNEGLIAEKTNIIKENEIEKERMKSQIEQLQKQIRGEITDHSNERQRNQAEVEQNIQNIRLLHDHEKHLLWTQLRGVQAEKQVIQSACDSAQSFIEEIQAKHSLEKQDHDREIKKLEFRIEVLEKENLKIGMYETLQANHENQLRQKDIILAEAKKRFAEQLKEVTLEVKKLEQGERNLMQLLKDKDVTIEDIRKDFQKKLALEKIKAETLLEAGNKIKEEYTKRNAFVIQEIIAKEEQVKSISKQLLNYGVSQSNKAAAFSSSSKSQMTFWTESLKRNSSIDETLEAYNAHSSAMVTALTGNHPINCSSSISNANTNNYSAINAYNSNGQQQAFTELAQRLSSPADFRNHSPKSLDQSFFRAVNNNVQMQQQLSPTIPFDLQVNKQNEMNAQLTETPAIQQNVSQGITDNEVEVSKKSVSREATPSQQLYQRGQNTLNLSSSTNANYGRDSSLKENAISPDYLIPMKPSTQNRGDGLKSNHNNFDSRISDRKSKYNAPIKERVPLSTYNRYPMSVNLSRNSSQTAVDKRSMMVAATKGIPDNSESELNRLPITTSVNSSAILLQTGCDYHRINPENTSMLAALSQIQDIKTTVQNEAREPEKRCNTSTTSLIATNTAKENNTIDSLTLKQASSPSLIKKEVKSPRFDVKGVLNPASSSRFIPPYSSNSRNHHGGTSRPSLKTINNMHLTATSTSRNPIQF